MYFYLGCTVGQKSQRDVQLLRLKLEAVIVNVVTHIDPVAALIKLVISGSHELMSVHCVLLARLVLVSERGCEGRL